MYVIFLHGLQSGDDQDPHLSTWKSRDGSCLWPQSWLIERFPGAHVLSVSYTAHVKKNMQGEFDIYNIGENLLADILQLNIGQAPYCPVIFVGHCFGGFVIKELCNRAFDTFSRTFDLEKKVKLRKFLENIWGIYYYGTPHHGSPLMNTKVHHLESDLLEYFKLLSKEGARLNDNFEQLRRLYPKWRIHGLGESRSTKSGLFQGLVGAPEASSRAGDSFHVVEADHIQICRPEKETSRSFYGLVDVLGSIAKEIKEEEARLQEENARAAEKTRLQNLKYLPKQIIGIEVPIQEVKTKLVKSRTLGLVGMGGCGKTTLAKAIFNNLERGFEYSAFKLDVKLISGGEDDLKEKVWSQMHHFGEQMTTKPNWSLLSGKSLLLVLDDVSSDRDLEVVFDIAKSLSPESRFLVTSRDHDLLRTLDDMYEVPFLNGHTAKELFMSYAFPKQDAAPSQLDSLVDAIVAKCDGLPLTLEIIGKYLHKKDEKQDWEQTLIALGRADSVTGFNEKLWKKLKLSFLGLQEEEQQMFLDVATFFCGNQYCTLGEAKVAWKAAYAPSNERLLWRTLVDRSLVYDVHESETIQMHEQLLDLGRKIGAKHNKICRVWDQKEAVGLFHSTLQRHDEEIFALRLHPSKTLKQTLTISRRTLLRLKDVRYLDVDAKATIHGDQEDKVEPFLTNLVLVRLRDVHQHFTQVLFDSSILTGLVILHLSGYNGEDLPKSIIDLSALKILKLEVCDNLHSLPQSFGHLSTLTNLQFSRCYKLQTLPESFGHLSALTNLKFRFCRTLQTLPESFGHLSALTNLKFHSCDELQTLPESFGHLSVLTNLQFKYCDNLQTLPESFGHLSVLTNLQFKYCDNLQTLPESFGHLSALTNLQFQFCGGLQTLPELFGHLSVLTNLKFRFCRTLQTLPESFGHLSALTNLELTSCPKLQTLPESFGHLSALTNLKFHSCDELQTLPESFGHLSALTNLQFKECDELQTLPDTFGQLSALQHLQFHKCGTFCVLSSSFGQLTKLEDFKISDCLRLDILPDSFAELTALRHLSIERVALTIVPDSIHSLPSLQVLELGCLPFVKEFPPWLGDAEAGLRKMSINTFHVQDGNFAVAAQRSYLDEAEEMRLKRNLYSLAFKRVESSNLVMRCDHCAMYPLEWPRYESITTFHYNLCPKCFQQSGTNATEYNCVDCPIHPFVKCEGCEMFPLKGPRYKSSTRSNFDLCHDCFQRSGSNASEYNCFDPPILSAGDGTTDILDSILALDVDDRNSEIHCSPIKVQYRAFISQERGVLKRLVGDLLGALEDLNKALDIGLSQELDEAFQEFLLRHKFSSFDLRMHLRYTCLKHRGYVKFLLGDLDGAQRDAQETLSIGSKFAPDRSLGGYSVKFLDFEMR